MVYLSAFVSYLKEEKTRHDCMDYARALLIILSIIAVLKAALDMIC
ncbi:MAG: hypothetical protein LLG02_00385 [Pelosinus sp.]|nr:hypothetical protein [Pelosinus sp.]